MKFNVGDKVRIKKDLSQCKFGGSTYMNEYMNEYVDKEATVTETYDGGLIKLDIDGNEWNWREEVLELIEDSKKKMKRIDYILNAKDNMQAILDETTLDCNICPASWENCNGDCEFNYKKYLNEEIEVNKSKLKLVEENIEVENKKNCKDCDYFVKSSLGNYCDFYGILLNIMHGCNEFQLKKHKEGIEDIKTKNIENDTINPFMEEYEKIVNETVKLCKRKNKDYGNATDESFKQFGDVSYQVRCFDKWSRINTLLKNGKAEVSESLEDSLLDLSNYLFLWVTSRRLKEK